MRVSPDQRNRSLRCDYHRDHGHETNQCQGLKFMIERLIRAGHLRRFIREPTRTAGTAPASNMAVVITEHSLEPRPTINFILGGPVDNRYLSKKQRRKMLRAALIRARINTINTRESSTALQPIDGLISFPPIDPTWIITPHYDALLLSLCINNFDVHRVLVDPSNAAELLHLPALTQMKVPFGHLNSAGRVLSGFNGSTTLTVGDISLSVKAGPVTQQVLFLVVKYLGPYNAIMGRTWLHAMKAIPSTYHQTISYLTASGQVDLQSSQLVARQCYQLSVHELERDKEPDSSSVEAHPSSYQLRPAVWAALEDKEQLVVNPLQPIVVGSSDRCTYVSSLLTEKEKAWLQQALTVNVDVFAWNHSDMTGINPVNASHKLNVLPSAKPIQ